MPDDSSDVGRATVIDVLRRHGVEVSCDDSGLDNTGMVSLFKDGEVDARRLPSEVSRRVLHYLARRFGVPIHHFYNPHMAPMKPGELIQ
jgi:hypothetical protein